MKRNSELQSETDGNTNGANKKDSSIDAKLTSQYTKFYPDGISTELDTIKVPETDKEQEEFFKNYVALRKPCKILGVSPKNFPLESLKYTNVKEFLDADEILQIEKRVDGGFGSGRKRTKMAFGQFIDKLVIDGEIGLYLTTQYYEDDPENGNYSSDEDEKDQVITSNVSAAVSDTDSMININDLRDDFDDLQEFANEDDDLLVEHQLRVRELYQPPMMNLVNSLPETPDFLKYLIPQQINLWIGANGNKDKIDFAKCFDPNSGDNWMGLGRNIPGTGSSSGLHHDHADNIYIPINGHKRFTLFAPGDAAKMYTVGNIRQIYESGIIDYLKDNNAPHWRQLRDDGAIVAEVYKTLLDKDDGTLNPSEKAKYEQYIKLDAENLAKYSETDVLYMDPPSFSTIPPAFVHLDEIEDSATKTKMDRAIESNWPLFKKANRLIVDVKPGEMLYLPTGWFHEVTSFGQDTLPNQKNNIHVAVNYWFIPPNGDSIANAYNNEDQYWPNDYIKTKSALSHFRADANTQ